MLEIGVGTGLNLERYRFADKNFGSGVGGMGQVERVTGIDLSPGMLQQARKIVCMRPWRK